VIEEEHRDHLGRGTWRGRGDPVRGIRNSRFGYRCSKTGPNRKKVIRGGLFWEETRVREREGLEENKHGNMERSCDTGWMCRSRLSTACVPQAWFLISSHLVR